jgi:23S rRNA (uracil1939-C5)-methyltransferase
VQSTLLPLEVVPAEQPLNYRNKATYHTEKRNGKWLLGYRREQSHDVEEIIQDPLACPEINKALPDIRSGVLSLLTRGAKAVRDSAKAAENVTIRYTPIDGVKWWLGDPPLGMELTEKTCGLHFRVPADGFYQVNPLVADRLVATVRDAYLEGVSDAGHLLDLYCGVGVFGICCMKALGGVALKEGVSARLVGIESARASIACAKRNAEALGVKANFFCERVGASLGKIKVGPHHTVILDPPRGGLEPNVPGWLVKRQAPRIFYVSCDPATLTRDLSALIPAYRIEKVILFDLFPRTARFETFVQLARN